MCVFGVGNMSDFLIVFVFLDIAADDAEAPDTVNPSRANQRTLTTTIDESTASAPATIRLSYAQPSRLPIHAIWLPIRLPRLPHTGPSGLDVRHRRHDRGS